MSDLVRTNTKKTLADHLSGFGETLKVSWPLSRPVLIDAENIDHHSTSTYHPIDDITKDAQQSGKSIIPVYSPDYSQNYLIAVQRNCGNGIALRLKLNDYLRGAYHIPTILRNFNFPPTFIDLIIDLEDIKNASIALQQQVIQMCNNLMTQANWRNVIISSTCYPSSQAGIPINQIHLHPREEWQLWSSVIQSQSWIKTPNFSDYPTAASTTASVNPRFMSQTVSIRYSDQNNWIFVKGLPVKGNGWGQTQQLCQLLVNSTYYFGRNYSWGDEYIDDRANNINTSGGSKEWRKVAHTHHLTCTNSDLI
ncbi:beta family protein [Photobacterium arenosum]|uniref:beta family protein n=1 Tax=Photobacterium arenosum TaxID=2774143 RepID=UPI00301331F0